MKINLANIWKTQPDFINILQGHSLDTQPSLSPTLQTNQPHAEVSYEVKRFVSKNYLTPATANSYRFTILIYPNVQILVSFAECIQAAREGSRLTVFFFLGLSQQSVKYLAVFSKVLPNGSIMRIFILQHNCSYGWLLSKPPEKTSPQKISNKIQRTDGTKSF